jgi:microcystin-dependent protein
MLGTTAETVVIPGSLNVNGKINQSLVNTFSTQLGTNALLNLTSDGNSNTCIGVNSGYYTSTGDNNSSLGANAMKYNSTGSDNTCIGYDAMVNGTTAFQNTIIGSSSGSSISTGSYNTCIGYRSSSSLSTGSTNTTIGFNSSADNYSYSTALGYSATNTASNQIMLGTVNERVVVPNDITFNGSINDVTRTVLSYIKNVSSDVQNQINTVSNSINNIGNNALVLYSTLNVSGFTTLTEVQVNTSLNVLQNISFLGSLNGITTSTFSFLSGLSSNIQNQINSISNTTPVGSVISFAGNSSSLSGYLKCDGTLYTISSYQNLYNVIGTMYGGDSSLGYFNVPNYQGVFLRGAGSQNLALVYGEPAKQYSSPPLGAYVVDKSVQPANYVTGITQNVRSFVTSASLIGAPSYNFNYSNAVASLQYTTANESGVVETFPVHTSINYFIKY